MRPPDNALQEWLDSCEDKLEARLRALGTRLPRCSRPDCDETNPFALTGIVPSILCYEHRAEENGRRWLEDQHWFGQHNDPLTSPIPGNDHRVLSAFQDLWPRNTLRNAEASPLLKAAAALRAWLDVMRFIVDRVVGWVPPFLEWLDRALVEQLSPRWWDDLGWDPQ